MDNIKEQNNNKTGNRKTGNREHKPPVEETSPLTDGTFPATMDLNIDSDQPESGCGDNTNPADLPNPMSSEEIVKRFKKPSKQKQEEQKRKQEKRSANKQENYKDPLKCGGSKDPRRIVVGSSVHLICLNDLALKLNRPKRSVAAFCKALEVPPIHIGNTCYYNEKALERMLYVLTKPGQFGFAAPGSKYKKTAPYRERNKKTGRTNGQKPKKKLTEEQISEARSPEVLLEMKLETNNPPAKVIKNVMKKIVDSRASKDNKDNKNNKDNKDNKETKNK